MSSEEPGSSEYDHEFLMTTQERDQYDREQQVAREAAAAAEEARLADLERRRAEVVGADIFGRPLASPRTPQIQAADDLDLKPG